MSEIMHQFLHHFTGICGESHPSLLLLLSGAGLLKLKQVLIYLKEILK
jgi:hypothetical protein